MDKKYCLTSRNLLLSIGIPVLLLALLSVFYLGSFPHLAAADGLDSNNPNAVRSNNPPFNISNTTNISNATNSSELAIRDNAVGH